MNASMNIPTTLAGIRNEDIPKLARYADKEANPLYPVPILWDDKQLALMYHLVQEKKEKENNSHAETGHRDYTASQRKSSPPERLCRSPGVSNN
mgnify:CR=1 FL=1